MTKKANVSKAGKKLAQSAGKDKKTRKIKVKSESKQESIQVVADFSAPEETEHQKISNVLESDQAVGTKPKSLKWRIALFAAVICLLSSTFAAFVSADKSLAMVKIGDLKLDPNSSNQVLERQIQERATKYKITLTFADGSSKDYRLEATGVSVDAKASAKKVRAVASGNLTERLTWWQPVSLEVVTKTDKEVMTEFINTHARQVSVAPKNAALVVDGGLVKITPEEAGSGSRLDSPQSSILTAAGNFSSKPLPLRAGKILPDITRADLHNSQTKLSNLLNQQVSFTIAGRTVSSSRTDIAGMLDIAPAASAKTVDVTVNSGKVLQYINRIAKPYIQPPRSRLITKIDGNYMVLDQGSNGVDVVNKDQTATEIAQKLLEGNGVSMDLPVKYAAAKTVETQPYEKWIVVDVTTKRMYAYQQTNLVKSFLVSAGAPRTPTVIGTFAIYAKHRSQDMRGANADGTRYFQPSVPYINYFYKDYAIHGNYWRPISYFGNINSSHGCVGITTADASWIYNWAPIGTPVITHT